MSTSTASPIISGAPGGRPKQAIKAEVQALEEWAAALPCQRPVRMMRHAVDEGTGEIAAEGKEILMRCGTREVSKCPPCAALYRGDARAVIYEGLRAAQAAGEQIVFLTLTAPSFGETHRVPPAAPPRLNRRQRAVWKKRYGRPCRCGLAHSPGDTRWKGLPLNGSIYDYAAQVRWNSEAGRLWSRTADEIARLLGVERLTYIATAEWQARGAIHLHVIVRVPKGVGLDLVSDPARTGQRSALIERACFAASTYTGAGRTGDRITWGHQVVAEAITTERTAFRTAGYLAKLVGYAVKDLGAQSGSGLTGSLMRRHHERLTEAAEAMLCGAPGTEQHALCRYRQTGDSEGIPMENHRRSRCRSLRHRQWGWRGHVIRRSRSWAALTMTECRRRRAEFGKLRRELHALAAGLEIAETPALWLRPTDGMPMQIEEHAWPRLRDGYLASLKALLT